MKLHTDKDFFASTIRSASQHLNIKEEFVEKDYWITLVLSLLAKSKFAEETVFKGGTSLSKGFGLIDRFSEDVDLAIINVGKKSGNEIKTIIRTVEKDVTKALDELVVDGITSKGSRFRKSVFEYASTDAKNKNNKLIVEVNSFANPFPFEKLHIKSMLYDFLLQTENTAYVEQYDLQPFSINVLNKEQTLVEKLVSLIRFSFDANAVESISKKIRHFYDLYFLVNDAECAKYIQSAEFKRKFDEVLAHDKVIFNDPTGWEMKPFSESPLLIDFDGVWEKLKSTYKLELSALSYSPIPDEGLIAQSFFELAKLVK